MNIKPPLYEVKKKCSPDIILVFCGEETLTVVKNSNSLSRWLSLMGVKVSKSPLLSRAMDPPHLLLVGVLAGTARYSSSYLMAAQPHEPPPPPACWASQPSQVIFQSYRPLSSHGRSSTVRGWVQWHGARNNKQPRYCSMMAEKNNTGFVRWFSWELVLACAWLPD